MNNEVIISCAVTGSGDTAGKHPELPICLLYTSPSPRD